ncbi:hypothetical protein BGZ94_007767 [Podila epigama]|nr:hypothetical protein BGZ94_007767 [Podila epigama]
MSRGLDTYLKTVESTRATIGEIYKEFLGSGDSGDKLAHLLIRTIAFHPHHLVLAVALWDNSVWVYDLSQSAWYASGLSHKSLQSRVTTLQWKPMSGTILTIGCEEGVSVWHVFKGKYAQDPFSKDARFEAMNISVAARSTESDNFAREPIWDGISRFEGLCGTISQLAWDPRGELLAVSSAQSSTVYIRDGATQQTTVLSGTMPSLRLRSTTQKVGNGITSLQNLSDLKDLTLEVNYVCSLAWSPDSEYLLVSYQSGLVQIFSAATWEAVEIKDIEGAIQSACWTPDGHNLIYTLQEDDIIRALHIEKRGGELTWIRLNYVRMSLQIKDIERYKRTSSENASGAIEIQKRLGNVELDGLKAFGPIEQVVLDPTGERLVVRYRNSDLLGVVLVRPTGTPLRDLDIFLPLGYIRGPASPRNMSQSLDPSNEPEFRDPKAVAMSFAKLGSNGSLLSLGWESGAITFTPFYYLSQQQIDK